jgi:arginine repressor
MRKQEGLQKRRFEDIKKLLKNLIFETVKELAEKLQKFFFHI